MKKNIIGNNTIFFHMFMFAYVLFFFCRMYVLASLFSSTLACTSEASSKYLVPHVRGGPGLLFCVSCLLTSSTAPGCPHPVSSVVTPSMPPPQLGWKGRALITVDAPIIFFLFLLFSAVRTTLQLDRLCHRDWSSPAEKNT